jgi:1-aminocyclopropane-1-carboxylate deaminase
VSLSDFPRYPLLFGPSPVQPLERLSAQLGGPMIWAKREDCNSGLAFGGNKTRKLEYLVPDALAEGADTLVSIGGVQSNHTRQVAAVAAMQRYRLHPGRDDRRIRGPGPAAAGHRYRRVSQA